MERLKKYGFKRTWSSWEFFRIREKRGVSTDVMSDTVKTEVEILNKERSALL